MITIGNPEKSYKDFKDQVSDDDNMKTLGVKYAQATKSQQKRILDQVAQVMFDYPIEYIKQAQLFIKMYASLASVFIEFRRIEKEMKEASKSQQYEKAKDLRDQLHDLGVVFSHAKIFKPIEEKTPIHWPEIEKYLQKILSTTHSISRVEAYDISNMQGKESTSSMPVFINGAPAKEHYRKFKIHITGKPNDFAMMEETITRRLRHTEWQYPDLMIIDGGKGQLSSVLKAIEKFGTKEAKNILVAAIAKKNNELFLPGKSQPLLLRDMPQPVSNLILHIRDEAHRFAISYHRKLRKRELLKQ